VRGVLLISVDGLRPDLVASGDTPALHALMARGSYSLTALTTDVAITLPSHTSMVTGVPPDVHGITWNGEPPPGARLHPARPTLFELAHKVGYGTAMVAGKSKFVALDVPGSIDRGYVPTLTAISDTAVADTAVRWIDAGTAPVMFVHLPAVDLAGHAHGWGSQEQLAAIAYADRCIGRMLDALERRGRLESTVVLVTADHGGSGKTHGRNVPLSHDIPWILAGPGIRHGVDLTAEGAPTIHTEDTFATLCSVLGIPIPNDVAGHVVDAAFGLAGKEAHAAGATGASGH
jgi:arylsulfatase A-like enzyme